MSHDDGSLGCAIVVLGALLLIGSCAEIDKRGYQRGECVTRGEFALTGIDTLAILRAHPKCGKHLIPENGHE